ncbi:hypothetical protein [Microbulbifer sp. ZKSA004]|uniref:hypothetical protein n=1 Tax=unclassified Microbulbifer TaxID=2619833 RepID=UPI00403A7177
MKDVVDAIDSRIKSPYFGYAFLAFITLNWRGIFLLVVSSGTPTERLALFDEETNYWTLVVLPLIVGALVAASTHWIKYYFLLIARTPVDRIDASHLQAEHRKAILQGELEQKRADLAARKEKELIERAKIDESISEISDESKKKELEVEIGKIRKQRDFNLTSTAIDLLTAAAADEKGIIMVREVMGGQSIQAGNRSFGKDSKRSYAKCRSALQELIKESFVAASDTTGNNFGLTHEGWQLVDSL